jgi:hypothetical protein
MMDILILHLLFVPIVGVLVGPQRVNPERSLRNRRRGDVERDSEIACLENFNTI